MYLSIKRLTAVLMLCCLVSSFVSATAQEAGQDITKQCRIHLPGGKDALKKVLDRNYQTAFWRYGSRDVSLIIDLPGGVDQGGIYLCFGELPMGMTLYAQNRPDPVFSSGEPAFAHVYVPFKGEGRLRLDFDVGARGISISEVQIISGENPPSFVQLWQPSHTRADLLIVVAHPDDELLWMGGAIPYYAGIRQNKVVVSYMTCANFMRRSELLDGLWAAGVRHYPDIGTTFLDKHVHSMKELYQFWKGEERIVAYLTARIRRFQPLVILTHDLAGEYGHPAHKATSRAMVSAVGLAGNADFDAESASQYGLWETPKLYLHLYPENQLVMEWDALMDKNSGLSSMELARLAFSKHRSQLKNYRVEDGGPFDNKQFGLFRSMVGKDELKNDFFENITQQMFERRPD